MNIELITPVAYQLMSIIIGLAGFCFLVAFHELGHFLFCKLFGIHTPSFSVGFGPELYKKKIGDTDFLISAIPLGGYVEIAGLAEPGQGDQEHATARDKRSFFDRPYYQKALVLLGGILFNLLFAYAVLVVLFYTGFPATELFYPTNRSSQITAIKKDGAAEQAGLKEQDILLGIQEKEFLQTREEALKRGSFIPFAHAIENNPNTTVTLIVDRPHEDGSFEKLSIPTHIKARACGETTKGSLEFGVKAMTLEPVSLSDALGKSWHILVAFSVQIFELVTSLFKGCVPQETGGPLMILTQTVKSVSRGFGFFFFVLAMLSINLAVINLFPLPILDGGQLLIVTIESLLGRRLSDAWRIRIGMACWILMLLLIVLLTIKDFRSLWSGK